MNMVEPKHFSGLRGTLALDAPLAKHTSWRAGGGADIVYTPADRDDLAAFLRQLPIFEQVTAIGLGSNTLVRDGGVRGAVVLMHNPMRKRAWPARSSRVSRRCTAVAKRNFSPAFQER